MEIFDNDGDEIYSDYPKLDGRNIREWYRNIQMSLVCVDLWDAADPHAEADEEAELEAAEISGKPAYPSRDQSRALWLIRKMCDAYASSQITGLKTGRAALRKLLERFRRTDAEARSNAHEKFLTLRIEDHQDIMSWCSTVEDFADAYTWAGGRKLEEIELIAKFRQGLRDRYRGTMPILELASAVPSEELKMFDYAISFRNFISSLRSFDDHDTANRASRERFPPKNPLHKYSVCQKCAKIGHIAIDCRSQVQGMATSQQVQRSEKRAIKRREKEEEEEGKPSSSFGF